MKKKLAVSLLCLQDLKNIDLLFNILKKEKIKYIELPISKISINYLLNKKLKDFSNDLKKNYLRVSSIQSIFYKKNWNIFKIENHEVILLHLKKVFRIAKFLKAQNIIFGSPKNRFLYKNVNKENSIIFFNKVKKIAGKYNINFCIEPNAKYYNCNYINSIADAINLVKLINHKNILINADTGNISLEKDDCKYANQNYNLFANFQLSERNLISLSKGNINHLRILNKFKINKQFISLEMHNVSIVDLKNSIKKFKKIISKIKTE